MLLMFWIFIYFYLKKKKDKKNKKKQKTDSTLKLLANVLSIKYYAITLTSFHIAN